MDQGQTSRRRRARAIAITETARQAQSRAIVKTLMVIAGAAAAVQAAWGVHLVLNFIAAR